MTGSGISGEPLRTQAATRDPAGPRNVPALPDRPQRWAVGPPSGWLERDAGSGDRAPSGRARTTLATLFLSVFLLLTGFFVLLVAMSEFDRDRTRRVLDSLGQRFARASAMLGGESGPAGLDPGLLGAPGENAHRDLRLGPPLTAEARRAGIVGRIEFAPDRLFDAEGRIPRARWLLLGRMAAVTRAPRGWRLEIAAPWPAGTDATGVARRLQAVLQLLERLGADRTAVRYGLRESGSELWSFLVRANGEGEPQ